MNVFELFGTIAIDHSEAERGLDKTVRHAKDAENALERTFKRIGRYVATAFSVSAIVNFGKTCTQVYADVAAEESAFAQIMGDYAETARDKLDAVADKTGITSTRMTSAFNSLTAKFKGLGYSTEDATTLAADGLMLAADASAFWNMSLDEAMAHLNSFINGSYEGGEAIGLFANDTQMAAYAIEKGIVADAAAWAQLDEATKQALRLDFARTMQANSGVTGQAAAEAGAYANVLGNLQEAWRQLQTVIGKPILERIVLPAMKKLNEFLPVLTENVQKGIDWLTDGFDKIAEYFSEVFTEDGLNMKALPNALRDMFRDVSRAIPSLLSTVGRSFRNAWVNTVWPAIQGAFKMAFGVELPKWSDIEKSVIAWWDGGNGIAAEIAKVCNWTLNMFGVPATVTEEKVSEILSGWWDNTKGLVSSFCEWTLKLFSNPVEAVADVEKTVKGWWTGVKSGAENALVWTLKLFGVPEAKADGVKNLVSGWWSGVKTAAQNALIWVLKLFENPKETAGQVATNISKWWAGVVASAQSALEWWLQLFQNPKETAEKVGEVVGDWWDGVKSAAQDALIWTLTLFGVPKADGNGVRTLVSSWWQGVKQKAQSALIWVLQMFGAPENPTKADIAELLGMWWHNVKTLLGTVCTWVLNMFGVPANPTQKDITDLLGTWWTNVTSLLGNVCTWVLQLFGVPENPTEEDIAKLLGTWWNGVTALLGKVCTWVLNMFGIPGIPTVDGLRNMLGTWWTGVKSGLATVCKWVLNMFGLPEGDPVAIITGWWNGIRSQLESVLAIDLSGIDIAGIFTAANTAIQGVVKSAKTFVSDVKKAISYDVHGRIQLGATLSNLFSPALNAITNLLTTAGNLVGDIVSAVTGDEEAGEKIGAVFSDLFSWANEVISNVKTGAIDAFKWLVDNKDVVIGAITGILGAFVVTNPVAAFFTAITSLVVALNTDWENFEENFPALVDMFEDLTGLDFTDVVTSLEAFKNTLGGILTFLSENSIAVDMLLMLAGAIAIGTGHPLMGAAFVTAGGFGVWNEALEVQKANEAAGYTDATSLENYLYYAQQMYQTPGKYGFSESELDDYIDILGTLNPSAEGYKEAATAVVDAWMRVNGTNPREDSSDSGDKPSQGSEDEDNDSGVPGYVNTTTFGPETYVPAGGMGAMSLVTMMQAMASQIKADVIAGAQEGVAAGLSGVTITANVSTGDIKLDDGTLVGAITPRINFILGALNARSGRG